MAGFAAARTAPARDRVGDRAGGAAKRQGVAGWALQSAIAYSATKAVGIAANEYFEHGAVADASRLRALAEGIKVELESRLKRRAS